VVPVAFKTKFFFGLGASADNAIHFVFNVLAFFYYQQILGLSGALAGTAVAIAICADAVTDPLVGSISDRFRSKYGRRHPFLFFAPIPLVITIFLIFSPPEAVVASKLGLFMWFVTFTVLLRTFQTIFAIPLLAMGAELSTDYTERSKIMSFESLFGLYGYVFMHVVAMIGVFGLLFEDQGGRLYQPAYTPVMLICCLFVLVTLFACAYGTRDQIPLLRQHEIDTPRASLRGLFSDIFSVMKNRNYRALLFGLFFLAVTAGTHETLSLYVATFLWDLNSYQLGFLILGNIVGTHLAFAVTPTLHQRFDRRWAIFWSCLIFSIFWSMPTNLKLLGIGPDAATWNAVLFIGCLKVISVCAGVVLTISVMAALADIADEHDLLTGQRQEGIFYSARTFFSKAMNAFGHIVAGFAIDYYIKLPPKSVPGEVAEDVVFRLGIIDGPFAMLWGIVGAFVYLGYRIDRQRYEEIRTQLDQRELMP
jgi:GPH family glycoside/pentoside/hexuronide:cation symporter